MNKLHDYCIQIERDLNFLQEIIPASQKEYQNNKLLKAACERYYEMIIENCIKAAHLILKKYNMQQTDKCFLLLAENNIISKKLSISLENAKGMRNIIVHQYGIIDDTIIYESIQKEFLKDIKQYSVLIKKEI